MSSTKHEARLAAIGLSSRNLPAYAMARRMSKSSVIPIGKGACACACVCALGPCPGFRLPPPLQCAVTVTLAAILAYRRCAVHPRTPEVHVHFNLS